MRFRCIIVRFVMPATLLAPLAACGEGATAPVDPAVYVTPASIILEVGEQRTLPVTRIPSRAQFIAESELTAVATVVQAPSAITITGVCEGFISVFLSLPAYPGIRSDVVVEVVDPSDDGEDPIVCA